MQLFYAFSHWKDQNQIDWNRKQKEAKEKNKEKKKRTRSNINKAQVKERQNEMKDNASSE